jgi:ABC-type sugar transport system ATPase subunit
MAETALLRMQGVKKAFGSTVALSGVDFSLRQGEVHAVIGENGAGKSTLMKILCGIYPMDEGTIFIDGAPARIEQPKDALALGINMIHQEFANFAKLSVAENVFVGKLPRRRGFAVALDIRELRRCTTEVLGRLRLSIDPSARLDSLSVAQQQLVEVAKALSENLRILIMDEATSSLNLREAEQLFATIEALKAEGISIIYISHRLKEVLNIADRISVLRDGANVGTFSRGYIDEEAIIEAMLGRRLQAVEKKAGTRGEPVFSVTNLSIPGKVRNLSFQVHKGEILGISGLSGSGKEVAIRGLYGLWPGKIERMEVNGKPVAIHHPSDGLSLGITYLAEERKDMSVFSEMTIRENASVLWLLAVWKRFVVNRKQEQEASLRSVQRVNVKMAGLESPVDSLSGGNQQKLLLARLLMVRPDIVILNDPTRGVDVGSKQEIYQIIFQLARQGVSIIMTSSEIPEVTVLADRVIVMSKGRKIAELSDAEVTTENVLALVTRAAAAHEHEQEE